MINVKLFLVNVYFCPRCPAGLRYIQANAGSENNVVNIGAQRSERCDGLRHGAAPGRLLRPAPAPQAVR